MYTENRNPFSMLFGKEPKKVIERLNVLDKISSDFMEPEPSNQIYLITGVRGSGKSAVTAKLMKQFSANQNWYMIDLNVEHSMLSEMLSKLTSNPEISRFIEESKVTFNMGIGAFGLDVALSKKATTFSVEADLDKILMILKKQKKRILVTIDDVVSNQEMRIFAHFFQSCLMKEYDVYLVMNGIFENISALQNGKSMTFLLRAPRIELEPLNLYAISKMYGTVFSYPESTLRQMARLTKGYSFAVQVLGYICFREAAGQDDIKLESVIDQYDYFLEENVYRKMWEDLSDTDRDIIIAVVEQGGETAEVRSIIEASGIKPAMVSNYKDKMIKKGIIDNIRGKFSLSLPRFDEFVRRQISF